jgi:hypothetical protein
MLAYHGLRLEYVVDTHTHAGTTAPGPGTFETSLVRGW